MIPVTISEEAAEEIRITLTRKNIPEGYRLRVGVRGGGCGVTPVIGFDKEGPDDLTFEAAGIPMLVDKRHVMFVFGKEVRFHNSAEGRGFYLSDESAK